MCFLMDNKNVSYLMLTNIPLSSARQLVFHHRHSLCEQLKQQTDPAMTLHLAVVILFQTITQVCVCSSTRVANVLQKMCESLFFANFGPCLAFPAMLTNIPQCLPISSIFVNFSPFSCNPDANE